MGRTSALINSAERTVTLAKAIDAVRTEALEAFALYPPFNSAHEGFAVLAEEVDELWDEVKLRQDARDITRQRRAAVRVGAMALRFIVDVCDGERARA